MSSTIFTCGPFASASVSLHGFSMSMYSSILIAESVKSQKEFEARLATAIQDQESEEKIETLRREADYYKGLLDITIAGLTAPDGFDQ